MFLNFFYSLKTHGIPVSLHEYLTLMEAMKQNLASFQVDEFYALSKTIMVKQEAHLDKFDQVFGMHFKGMELIPDDFFTRQFSADWFNTY